MPQTQTLYQLIMLLSNAIMSASMSDLLINRLLWRFVGFGSSIVGFICYALSPSFNNLFGEWSLVKIIIYGLVSFMFSGFILFANRWSLTRSTFLKANVCFLVLMITSVYSFYQDKSEQGKAEKGYGRMLSLISCEAFALMSLSLSRQIQLKFEVGMFNFFLGCLMVMVMNTNIKVALGAAAFCYVLISIRSYSDSHLENRGDTQHVIIDIDNSSHQQVDTAVPQDMDLDVLYDSDVDSVEASLDDEAFPNVVFLSYAGEDNFAENLIGALRRNNIKIYPSNKETRIGSRRSLKLLWKIESSKVSMIIFSRKYASSRWRMIEFDKIMDCKRRYGRTVIPIFLDIDLSEVKDKKGSFWNGLDKHEQIFNKKSLQRWKDNLTEAVSLPNARNLFLHRQILEDTDFVDAIAEDVKLCFFQAATETEHFNRSFDCNICLDCAQDPVVTLCGHLYCWPCIYKWLQIPIASDEHSQYCPVCKADISENSLIPLYGQGQLEQRAFFRDIFVPPRSRASAAPSLLAIATQSVEQLSHSSPCESQHYNPKLEDTSLQNC